MLVTQKKIEILEQMIGNGVPDILARLHCNASLLKSLPGALASTT